MANTLYKLAPPGGGSGGGGGGGSGVSSGGGGGGSGGSGGSSGGESFSCAQAAARILMGLPTAAAQISQLPSGGIAVTTHVGATFLYEKPVCEFGYVAIEPARTGAIHSS